ncbi:MAG: hypothetical protein P4L73_01220, partial [Caulobacteraceae bacterium]|nr:hypothetical protein [Caulobacteraceae bacterium]
MIRLAGLALAAAIAAAAGSGASPATENGKADPGKQPAHAADRSAELKDVLVKLDGNDLAGAQAALKAIVAAPKFKARPEREQYVFRTIYGRTLLAAKQPQEALVQLRLATAFPEADVATWGPRLEADAALHDNTDALASLTVIASRWPKSLAGFSDRYIMQLAFETRADEHLSDARFSLLQALRQAGWSPRDPFERADPLWRDLALSLLDRGQAQAAGAVAADIVAPETVLDMLIDRRFDAITTAAADR